MFKFATYFGHENLKLRFTKTKTCIKTILIPESLKVSQ